MTEGRLSWIVRVAGDPMLRPIARTMPLVGPNGERHYLAAVLDALRAYGSRPAAPERAASPGVPRRRPTIFAKVDN